MALKFKVQVHCDWEVKAAGPQKNWSHPQEEESDGCLCLDHFLSLIPLRITAQEMVAPQGASLPTSVNLIEIMPYRHAQRPFPQVTLDFSKLTVGNTHHVSNTHLWGKYCEYKVASAHFRNRSIPQAEHLPIIQNAFDLQGTRQSYTVLKEGLKTQN